MVQDCYCCIKSKTGRTYRLLPSLVEIVNANTCLQSYVRTEGCSCSTMPAREDCSVVWVCRDFVRRTESCLLAVMHYMQSRILAGENFLRARHATNARSLPRIPRCSAHDSHPSNATFRSGLPPQDVPTYPAAFLCIGWSNLSNIKNTQVLQEYRDFPGTMTT